MKISKFLISTALLTLSACAHQEVTPQPAKETKPSERILWQPNLEKQGAEATSPTAQEKKAEKDRIDIVDIERRLNLDDKFYKLGFHEKSFNPCLYGYKTKTCERELFTIINFQVVCRDSEGTVQNTNHILTPFALKPLHMKVGSHLDESQTDDKGYGQIRFLATSTAKESRFILSSPPFSLGLHAGEVKKIVVPSDWCE